MQAAVLRADHTRQYISLSKVCGRRGKRQAQRGHSIEKGARSALVYRTVCINVTSCISSKSMVMMNSTASARKVHIYHHSPSFNLHFVWRNESV